MDRNLITSQPLTTPVASNLTFEWSLVDNGSLVVENFTSQDHPFAWVVMGQYLNQYALGVGPTFPGATMRQSVHFALDGRVALDQG